MVQILVADIIANLGDRLIFYNISLKSQSSGRQDTQEKPRKGYFL